MNHRTCSIEDCESLEIARGWCSLHYQRWRRTGDPLAVRKNGRPPSKPRPCEYPGCTGEQVALGWCRRHYQQTRRTGESWGYRRMTVEERFFSYVTEETATGCWIYGKASGRGGYGQFSIKKKTYLAHRWVYEYMVAPIPKWLTIDHLCGVRPCVNPWHLEPVPMRVNAQRANRKR